jgi:hypothetical protein
LLESFARFGVKPAAPGTPTEPGIWDSAANLPLSFTRTHFESLERDPDEVFSFVWENRRYLKVHEEAYSRVLSVRPCLRVAADGFPLRETVAEFYQVLQLTAVELPRLQLKVPEGMPPSTRVSLYGGNALVFDEYGQLKFNIHNSIRDTERQQRRLDYLWEYGFFAPVGATANPFATMHLRRAMATDLQPETGEGW